MLCDIRNSLVSGPDNSALIHEDKFSHNENKEKNNVNLKVISGGKVCGLTGKGESCKSSWRKLGGGVNVKVTRLLEFDAGHRVMNHESKCATLHGHRYKVEIQAEAEQLDDIGRIIDFSVLKARIGTWLDEYWDHNCILWEKDVETIKALRWIPRKKEPFVAPWNPTAENMADYLLTVVCPRELDDTGVIVTRVRVWETPNCFADADLSQADKIAQANRKKK